MSGPKSYSPPPRYSMKAFRGQLNEVFRLQSRLSAILQRLETCAVSDPALKIAFDCRSEAAALRKAALEALVPLHFDYKGTFGQAAYDRVADEIERRAAALHQLLEQGEAHEAAFTEKQTHYQAYADFARFHQKSTASLEEFKVQALQILRENIENALPYLFQDTEHKIRQVSMDDAPMPSFDFSFAKRAAHAHGELVRLLAAKEKEINTLRIRANEAALEQYPHLPPSVVEEPEGPADSAQMALLERIETLIGQLPDPASQQQSREMLAQLRNSTTLNQRFHYTQLHDQIVGALEQAERKAAIQALIKAFYEAATPTHPGVEVEKQRLLKRCTDLLDSTKISGNEWTDLHARFQKWHSDNHARLEEDAIKARERLFLKTQIVLQLENMGYTVLDDLRVVDFEKDNSLLLETKADGSYLNLQFRDDGSFRYLFKSETPVSTLSTDQQKSILHDMQVTCGDFQKVLNDLEAMGLPMTKNQEAPAALDAILPLEAEEKALVGKRSGKGSENERNSLKNRFLNP